MGLFKRGDILNINNKLYELVERTSHNNCSNCPFVSYITCTNRLKILLGIPKNKYKNCNELLSGNRLKLVTDKRKKWKYVLGR